MKKIITILSIVIVLVATARVASFVIGHAPQQTEELVTVVSTYDNIVEIEREDGNIYSCYGTTDDVVLVAEFNDDELVDLHPVNYYTISEILDMCGDTYHIVKDSDLRIVSDDEYHDSVCKSAGIIDDIDEFGYCFFV